ncbi:hypothetical protein BV25DRAFT_1111046 [Artomyces pyxidatus]|uniref:Uncharacterized protein n=1 Tax=Artomyces pyxidatus TaxID=48021 RepID=A0ACB8TGC3_9AGAM|nr:hypothetical protein BV25DRAFT_1111046 [Artomyces pyxidatus]
MSSSLFVNLTELPSGGFPATELIKYLIEAVGHDVVAFRRNTQISYRLVDRVRDICNEINSLIQKVEDEDSWDSYDKFTAAIDPLEELLFALSTLTEDEAEHYMAGADSVDQVILSTEKWASNRHDLRDVLTQLYEAGAYKALFPDADEDDEEESNTEAGKHDDVSFFSELQQRIKDHALPNSTRGSVPGLIRDTYAQLDSLHTMLQGSASDDVTVLTIKSAMVVHGVMEVSENSDVDEEWMYHLKSEPIWQAANSLLEDLADVDEDDSDEVTAIREEYDEFLMLLRSIPGVELPDSYMQLMKHAGKIRRPFLAQALALVSLCRVLAKQFEETANRTAKNVYPLEDAFDETLTALQAGIDAVTEIKVFDLDTFETSDATGAFKAAQDRIKACFAHFGVRRWCHQTGGLC